MSPCHSSFPGVYEQLCIQQFAIGYMLKLSPSRHLVRGCLVPMREHHIPIPAFHRPCASPRNSVSLERLSWYLPRCPATCLPNAVYSVLYALPMYRHQYPRRIVLASLVLSFVRSQDLCTQHAVVLENVPHFRIIPLRGRRALSFVHASSVLVPLEPCQELRSVARDRRPMFFWS